MREPTKPFVQIQVAAEEGTQDVFIALDDIAFINPQACEIVVKVYQDKNPIVFVPTQDSATKLVDQLKRSRLVINEVPQ